MKQFSGNESIIQKGQDMIQNQVFTAFDDQLVRCYFHQLSGREIFCQIFIYLKEKKMHTLLNKQTDSKLSWVMIQKQKDTP